MQKTKKRGNVKPRLHLIVPQRPEELPSTTEIAIGDPQVPPPAPPTTPGDFDFLRRIEHNVLGELWLVRTPQGKQCLAQFLPPGENEAALQRLEFIHSEKGLAGCVNAQRANGQPLLLMEVPQKTLRERFHECWRHGQPGIPRRELLDHLHTAAQILDDIYVKYRVQHLGLDPKHLLLQADQLRIAGFGLVELFWVAMQQPIPIFNPRYSAPELFTNRIHARSDQFSLALIYAEMLTGVHPLRGCRDFRADGRLDLGLLSTADKNIVARALSLDPLSRFGSMSELVEALAAAQVHNKDQVKQAEPPSPIITCADLPAPGVACGSLDQFVSELVLMAAGPVQVREFNRIRYTLEPGQWLGHHCAVRTFPGAAHLKLEGFRRDWAARLVKAEADRLVFSVRTTPTLWQRLAGRQVGLEIQVQLSSPVETRLCEIHVVIRPFGCSRLQALQLLEQTGPRLLESLRSYLLAHPEQRSNERLLCSQPLRICPVVGGIELAEPIDCVSKDISRGGIGFFLPQALSTPEVYVNVPNSPDLAALAGLAKIVRKKPCGGGWYEIGATFARDR